MCRLKVRRINHPAFGHRNDPDEHSARPGRSPCSSVTEAVLQMLEQMKISPCGSYKYILAFPIY